MTTPVDTDDIVQGTQKWLAAKDDVRAALGRYPATDTPYLFQHRLWVTMENSSSTAAVILRAGGFTTPNLHNTMRFPRIGVEITVDPIRDENNNVADPGEANRRLERAYQVIDGHLHRPQGGEQYWGTVRTISCTRLTEPLTTAVTDGGGMLRLQVFYGVTEA